MEKANSSQIKRDCFIALLLPVALLSMVQIGIKKDWSSGWMIVVAILGLTVLGYYLYQFFIRLENLQWQEQLISLIKKMSVPVILADKNHDIVLMSDSLHRVSFLSTVLRHQKLPELLAAFNPMEDAISQCGEISNQTILLDSLTYKIKKHFYFHDEDYRWTLIPIFSPLGKRWGTLVECTLHSNSKEYFNAINETFPFSDVIDQLPIPAMIIGKNEQVIYVNLSLKMLLVRHQSCIQSLCPAWDLYEPIGDTLAHFLKLAKINDQSHLQRIYNGSTIVSFHDESYQWVVQDIIGEDHDALGTLVLWQDVQAVFDPIEEPR